MDWSRVRAAMERVLDARPDERPGLLAELETRDGELASEVRSLLEHGDAATRFLERAPRAPSAEAPAPAHAAGARLGRYELVRCLGSGGMGTVWEARQEAPSRRVALKVLGGAPRRWTRAERWRFEYEAEVLASLRHPGIAQVYETGVEEQGGRESPWFAMELVEDAVDVKTWLDRRGASREERLAVFRELCDAVQHGHQRGVIHRDLKPSNVLVDGGGHLKLIDFGIARAVEGSSAEPSLRTRTGTIVGTLPYVAPEQLRGSGEDVDVRCDVYALGVLLYELLAGSPPFEVGDRPLPEVARVLAEDDPIPPSRHDQSLAGDLEWILLRALEKDPARRYASVAELSAELGRFARHEPVEAGPPSRAYRLQKFVRRNRALVLGAAAVSAGMIVAVAGVTMGLVEARAQEKLAREQGEQARIERDRAVREAHRNRVILDLMEDLFLGVENTIEGRDVRVVDLLEAAALDFESRERWGADVPPDVVAEVEQELRTALGATYNTLREFEKGRRELERAWELVEEIDAPLGRRVGTAVSLGRSWLETGRMQEGERMIQEAYELARREGEARLQILASGSLLSLMRRQFRHEEMLALARERLDLALGLDDAKEVALSRGYLADALFELGREAEALEVCTEQYENHVELFGATDWRTIRIQSDLATMLERTGRLDEAETALSEVLELCRTYLGETHPLTLTASNNYAEVFRERGDHLRAAELFAAAVAAYDSQEGGATVDHLRTINNLGMAYKSASMQVEAEPHLRRAVEMGEELLSPDDVNLAVFRLNLGSCLEKQGRFEEAEPLLVAAWERFRHESPDTPYMPQVLRVLDASFERNWPPEDAARWREILGGEAVPTR